MGVPFSVRMDLVVDRLTGHNFVGQVRHIDGSKDAVC